VRGKALKNCFGVGRQETLQAERTIYFELGGRTLIFGFKRKGGIPSLQHKTTKSTNSEDQNNPGGQEGGVAQTPARRGGLTCLQEDCETQLGRSATQRIVHQRQNGNGGGNIK